MDSTKPHIFWCDYWAPPGHRYYRQRLERVRFRLWYREQIRRLNLPVDLHESIRDNWLEKTIEQAYATLDELHRRLDALEAADPEGCRQLPWFEARQAWKAAGRPRLPWWIALKLTEGPRIAADQPRTQTKWQAQGLDAEVRFPKRGS